MQNTSVPDQLAPAFRVTQHSEGVQNDDLLFRTNDGGSSVRKRRARMMFFTGTLILLAGGALYGAYWLRRTDHKGISDGSCASATVTLVQSTPVGDFAIPPVAGSMPTHEVLVRLADAATETLDLTAMYMALTGVDDRKIFNSSEMRRFGADGGEAVFQSLVRAATRGVAIRILLGTLNDPMNSSEVRTLLTYNSVQARTWEPKKWYGGGIMHLKLWHADQSAAYLGSANADWKSLAQVKELGVLINGSSADGQASGGGESSAGGDSTTRSAATADLGRIFEVFWRWAEPSFGAQAQSVEAFSETYQCELTLPSWDPAVPAELRSSASAPFVLGAGAPLSALTTASAQQSLCLAGELSPAEAFVSASPGGALSNGRTADIDALLATIRSAKTSLALSVMDFLPASGYSGGHGYGPVWWPQLVDAVLAVAYAKKVAVRVLVSKWAHTSEEQPLAMRRLADGLAACTTAYQKCEGSIEVRQYEVPGWERTKGRTAVNVTAVWPAFTRVNHAKYIVSDSRVNVGTSNWEWGYFHQTAGASWNTNASVVVAAAQAVFDADWTSPYATPL